MCVDRICGQVFNSVTTPNTSPNVPVYSYSKPFNIYVHTDSSEGSSSPAESSNRLDRHIKIQFSVFKALSFQRLLFKFCTTTLHLIYWLEQYSKSLTSMLNQKKENPVSFHLIFIISTIYLRIKTLVTRLFRSYLLVLLVRLACRPSLLRGQNCVIECDFPALIPSPARPDTTHHPPSRVIRGGGGRSDAYLPRL